MNTSQPTLLRKGESDLSDPRSERYFQQEGYWYFRTREGLDIGPSDTLALAMRTANSFVAFLHEAKAEVVTSITKYIKHQPRAGEKNIEIPQRSERVFQQDNYWYFSTREGMDIGPFDNRGDAIVGVKGFIGFLQESQPEVVEKFTHYISRT